MAVEILAEICSSYKTKYPMVQFAIHTGTADNISELMSKGLIDIALFLEPVNTEGFEYIRIKESDHWVLTIHLSCQNAQMCRVNLQIGLEKILTGWTLRLQVI